VIDNLSSDNTVSISKKRNVKVEILENGNVGAVRNYGASIAKSATLAFIDADCLVDKSWLKKALKLINANPNTAFGGPYKTAENSNWIEKFWLLESEKTPRLQEDLLGGCILITKDLFESIGRFNEEMTSGEDSDLSKRLKNNKDSCVLILEELAVIHLGNPKTISKFIIRQIWHSENYFLFLKASIKDKTFWTASLFFTSIISTPFCFWLKPNLAILPFTLIFILTVMHSAKRMIDANYKPTRIMDSIKILALDLFYLSGRAIGLIWSLAKLASKKKIFTTES
jgi:glycosyltransferase involved in cell wall biosynthesis